MRMGGARAIRGILGTIGLIGILMASAVSSADADLKREFQTLYERQAELLKKRDVRGFMEFNAPEYSVHLRNGTTLTREQLETGMSDFFTSGKLVRQIRFGYKLKEVAARGDTAVVLVEQKDKRVQIRRDGKPHEVEANVIHRETWVRTPEGWRRVLTEEVRQTRFTVDGKNVDL
jgi:hypothetical protein